MQNSTDYNRFREWVPKESVIVKPLDSAEQRGERGSVSDVGLTSKQALKIFGRERPDVARTWTVYDNRSFLRTQRAKVAEFAKQMAAEAGSEGAASADGADEDPESEPYPIVFLPGVSGQADCFFKQFVSLSPKGVRCISCAWPAAVISHSHFVSSFSRFLDEMGIDKCHLFGTSVGGFNAQVFCGRDTRDRVQSLILCNGFADTAFYERSAPCWRTFEVMPGFALQRMVLQNFPGQDSAIDSRVADSVDFMVWQIEKMGRAPLASRLMLNCSVPPTSVYEPGKIGTRLRRGRHVTLIDTQDEIALPDSVRDELYKLYPKARTAAVKEGGNFPFLSNADEVNVHITVHLRALREGELGASESSSEDEGEQSPARPGGGAGKAEVEGSNPREKTVESGAGTAQGSAASVTAEAGRVGPDSDSDLSDTESSSSDAY